jgi:hypothetical protein
MAKGKSQISGQAAGPSKLQKKQAGKKKSPVQRTVEAIAKLNPFD